MEEYQQIGGGEVKFDTERSKPFISAISNGQEESYESDHVVIHVDSWPVGTTFEIFVPVCPDCGLGADYQDKDHICECGFNWGVWAENKYGE